MDITPLIEADCRRLADRINCTERDAKHLMFAVFIGTFGLEVVRYRTERFRKRVDDFPERLVGVYEPIVDPEWILADVAAVELHPKNFA